MWGTTSRTHAHNFFCSFFLRPQPAKFAGEDCDGLSRHQGVPRCRQRHATRSNGYDSPHFIDRFRNHSDRPQRLRDSPRRAPDEGDARGPTLAGVGTFTGGDERQNDSRRHVARLRRSSIPRSRTEALLRQDSHRKGRTGEKLRRQRNYETRRVQDAGALCPMPGRKGGG